MNITQDPIFEKALVQGVRGEIEDEILSHLPANLNLEETARETKALVRRREITKAIDLLRMIFAYSVCDWSLRTVGAWCVIIGIGNLSDVGVLKRLLKSRLWLAKLVSEALQVQQLTIDERHLVRLRLMDGSSLSKPGSTGTDWRLHLSWDLASSCIDGIEVTDAKTGESFTNVPTSPGDIRVGDRGYCHAKEIGAVFSADGNVIVRVNWQILSLEDAQGNKKPILALPLPEVAGLIREHQRWLNTEKGRFAVRLIIIKLPQEAADKARSGLRRKYCKKGKPVSEKTLRAAGYIFVLTNLPPEEWSAPDILKIYRFRWQIELLIKRLKSILHLDQIRSQSSELTQVYILAKLLAALMIERSVRLIQIAVLEWFIDAKRPISLWRLTILLFESLVDTIRGLITISMIINTLPFLQRFLCEPPRLRTQQLGFAKRFITKFYPLS
jgi:hypothetical protein